MIAQVIPVWAVRKALAWFAAKFKGYRHHGDMRYLTDTPHLDYEKLRLISNPSGWDRTIWTIAGVFRLKWKVLSAHKITNYSEKLESVAVGRLDA